MTYQPRNKDEFFAALGPTKVRQGLVNGEFSGVTKTSAERWLEEHGRRVVQVWTRAGVIVAMLGMLVSAILTVVF